MSHSQATSINTGWPPVEGSHSRLRGFYPEPVIDDAGVEQFLDDFDICRGDTDTSRVTIQLIASGLAISLLHDQQDQSDVTVEGALPLARHGDWFVAFTAWNHETRRVEENQLRVHRALLDDVLKMEQSLDDPAALLRSRGFEPQFIEQSTSETERRQNVARFVELYGKFGHDQDDVEQILLNPSSIICYIEDGRGEVVSTSLAERATLKFETLHDIRIAEITEGVTRPDRRGEGLYRAVSGLLVWQLLEVDRRAKPGHRLDLVYGEANLATPGVIISAQQNGRYFNHRDGLRFGISDEELAFGILRQNVHVDDGRENRSFNDFVLTYVPPSRLNKFKFRLDP